MGSQTSTNRLWGSPRQQVKVVVLGPGEAGKSTLIAALCGNAINLEVRGRTVALDHGTSRYNGTTFHFFGVPGQSRFATVQESLLAGADIAVAVVRAGERLDPVTQHWCSALAREGKPLVLVINRLGPTEGPWAPAGEDAIFVEQLQLDLASKAETARLLPILWRLVGREESP